MTPDEQELVLALVTAPGRPPQISGDEVLRRFGEPDGRVLGLRLLQDAISRKDEDDVECSLIITAVFGVTDDYLDALLTLAGADWHHSHEDVVTFLQRLGRDESIDALCLLTQWVPAYLEYDEARALAVKSVWALSKIKSTRAVDALQHVSASGDPQVSRLARQRLRDLQDGS